MCFLEVYLQVLFILCLFSAENDWTLDHSVNTSVLSHRGIESTDLRRFQGIEWHQVLPLAPLPHWLYSPRQNDRGSPCYQPPDTNQKKRGLRSVLIKTRPTARINTECESEWTWCRFSIFFCEGLFGTTISLLEKSLLGTIRTMAWPSSLRLLSPSTPEALSEIQLTGCRGRSILHHPHLI